MMNYLWSGMLIFAFICAIFNCSMADLSEAILSSAQKAVQLCISLLGILCFWSGLMEIAEQSGLTKKVGKALSPLLQLIFSELKGKDEVLGAICMNVTANLLGLGNAATPLGIEAMKLMQKENKSPLVASNSMVNFVVMNTAAIEIIPTTVAMLRMNNGSSNPFEIVPIVLINSVLALVGGLILSKILCKTVK